jgi:hypothetical protein
MVALVTPTVEFKDRVRLVVILEYRIAGNVTPCGRLGYILDDAVVEAATSFVYKPFSSSELIS